MSTLNLLIPQTIEYDLELITFDGPNNRYWAIEFRGKKTREGLRVKLTDLISQFNLNIAYMKTVAPYLVAYSLQDLYKQDFYTISGEKNNDSSLFSEYTQQQQLFIKYKGVDILAHNVPNLAPFRNWLENVMDVNLNCYEKIDYDSLGW